MLLFISAQVAEVSGCLGCFAEDNLVQMLHDTEHSFYLCSVRAGRGLYMTFVNHHHCMVIQAPGRKHWERLMVKFVCCLIRSPKTSVNFQDTLTLHSK